MVSGIHAEMRWCRHIFLMVMVFVASNGSEFLTITNRPELARRIGSTLYKYAITSDPTALGTMDVQKDGRPITGYVETGDLVRARDSLQFGCYLKIQSVKGGLGSVYGVYRWTATVGGEERSINSLVKPVTSQLDTRGRHTITVFPDPDNPLLLNEPLTFGVKYNPGCQKIKWNKGRRRGINTGRTLTLTKVEGAAGIYEIYRGRRRSRGWSVHIEIIVSDCPKGTYIPGASPTCSANCPDCYNGGVCGSDGLCRCPPFLRGIHCRYPDAWINRPRTNDYYYVGAGPATWDEARVACEGLGGYLAAITSAAENQFIADDLLNNFGDISSATALSIGLDYAPTTDTGTWLSGEALDYTNWGESNPTPIATFTAVAIAATGASQGMWQNLPFFLSLAYICERQGVDDPWIIESDNFITCGQLPGGNRQCKGYHVCYGDVYGCSCASGWHGNACDKECRKGFYGPDCTLRCMQDAGCSDKQCDRYTGRC